jgi:hypothetical protein
MALEPNNTKAGATAGLFHAGMPVAQTFIDNL